MIELETQIIQILKSENTNPTNVPEESETEDIKVTFLVFSLAGNFSIKEVIYMRQMRMVHSSQPDRTKLKPI